jgi:hypothetical protein
MQIGQTDPDKVEVVKLLEAAGDNLLESQLHSHPKIWGVEGGYTPSSDYLSL